MTFSLFFKQADGGEHTTRLPARWRAQRGRTPRQGCADAYKALRIIGIERWMIGIERSQVICRLAS
jgi:hypothetical protein